MSKAGSKNNAAKRMGAKEFFFSGKKIKPVKIIAQGSSILGAEYDDTGDIVLCKNGSPVAWRELISENSTKN